MSHRGQGYTARGMAREAIEDVGVRPTSSIAATFKTINHADFESET